MNVWTWILSTFIGLKFHTPNAQQSSEIANDEVNNDPPISITEEIAKEESGLPRLVDEGTYNVKVGENTYKVNVPEDIVIDTDKLEYIANRAVTRAQVKGIDLSQISKIDLVRHVGKGIEARVILTFDPEKYVSIFLGNVWWFLRKSWMCYYFEF